MWSQKSVVVIDPVLPPDFAQLLAPILVREQQLAGYDFPVLGTAPDAGDDQTTALTRPVAGALVSGDTSSTPATVAYRLLALINARCLEIHVVSALELSSVPEPLRIICFAVATWISFGSRSA